MSSAVKRGRLASPSSPAATRSGDRCQAARPSRETSTTEGSLVRSRLKRAAAMPEGGPLHRRPLHVLLHQHVGDAAAGEVGGAVEAGPVGVLAPDALAGAAG